jgi:hypothetical protein
MSGLYYRTLVWIWFTCLSGKVDIDIVDLWDKFTGWIEAKKTKRVTSAFVADFIFKVMCCFRCLVKLTVDNGSEYFDRIAIRQVLPYEAMPHNLSVSDKRINVQI